MNTLFKDLELKLKNSKYYIGKIAHNLILNFKRGEGRNRSSPKKKTDKTDLNRVSEAMKDLGSSPD